MAQITGVEAAGWHELTQTWWQFVLIGCVLVSIGLGFSFLLYLIFSNLRKRYLKHRSKAKLVPSSIKRYISKISQNISRFRVERTESKPGSYGVYLGEFESPPTAAQLQLLTKWELLIVDPSKSGITEAISSGLHVLPSQILARLDVASVANLSSQKPIILAVEWIVGLLVPSAKESDHTCSYTGVLVSDWQNCLSTPLVVEFIIFVHSLGLSVYLETAAPEFLADPKLAELHEVTGLVVRNGTISANGEERDAFQMAEMRATIKAFVSQACLRSFVVLLWETLEDDTRPLNAVVKRSYQWSRFYSALPWIGSKSALISAELSLDQEEPLGAFDWLKELKVMNIHEKWRSNQIVSFGLKPWADPNMIYALRFSIKVNIQQISPQYILENSQVLRHLHSLLSIELYSESVSSSKDSFQSFNYSDTPSLQSSSVADPLGFSCEASSTVRSVSLSRSSTPTGYLNSPRSLDIPESLSWLSLVDKKAGHGLSSSPKGSSYDYLGCFPLGVIATRKSFADVAQSQKRLKEMKLLDELKSSKLQEIGRRLEGFCDALSMQDTRYMSDWLAAMQELAQQLSSASVDGINPLRVHIGLASGFQINPGSRFWAVYSLDEESVLDIFLSRNVQDFPGAILHTFLSSRGCPRHECFQAEMAFAEWSQDLILPSRLPSRLLNDITLLSPTELLRFLQFLTFSPITGDPLLIDLIRAATEAQLLNSTDFMQLRELSSIKYLSGRASAHDLIDARLQWYESCDCRHPENRVARETFLQTGISISKMLRQRKISDLQAISENLASAIQRDKIDARIDLLALSIFCAMRKHAFDEAYMEVTDRNTLFNDQSDQAAAFAELFATGARCEAYFDITPSSFGKLLSDRYRAYHHQDGHEPPIWSDREPATPSAYAAAKIDVDPSSKRSVMSAHQRFTFLSVFAIPALLDILLLTSTGRGLYLSGFMSHIEQHSATLALMISLLISGAVGTWITCGGSYYLISMAFSAMNLFVVTRLVGGLAFTLAAAVIGLAAVGATNGIAAGVIFFLYLIVLTSYLCLLATLANFQYPGSAFQSGRPIIIMVIPFLFISPVLTIWVPHHDIYIYLSVLYTFTVLLGLGVRYKGSRWTTWYLKIENLSDQALREWYIKTYEEGNAQALAGLTDPAALKLARDAILREVTKVRKSFRKISKDPLVVSLAKSHNATIFLLEWYSGYSGTPLPIPYSSTWNMQIKVALQTLKQLQTGIRLHNAFIHWRQAGDEVGCSLLYFIVALLDKWNALLAGGQLLGLSAMNTRYRMPVGFALAYYLLGAVLLDFNAAKLHTMTAKGQNMLIGDVSSIPDAVHREVRARRYLYWTMLGRYLLFHVWSLAVASSLLWVFDSTEESTILFIAYIGAYTGLLWYQYTKIFSGPRSLKPLIVAVLVGLPLGQLLRHFFPEFMYCDVTALGVATWTAGILSLYYARIKKRSIHGALHRRDSHHSYRRLSPDGTFHAFANPGKDPLLSQDELRIIYDNLSALREEERYQVDPHNHPGLDIKSVLSCALRNCRDGRGQSARFALEAFPEAAELLEQAIFAFENGSIVVDCIPMAVMTEAFSDVRSVSCSFNGHVRIVTGCEMVDVLDQQSSINIFCRTTAELVVHTVAESLRGLPHEDAALAEVLLAPTTASQTMLHSPVPQSIKNYMLSSKATSTQAKSLAQYCEDQALQHLALGLDPDLHWERLPRDIRELIIKRCTGLEEELTTAQCQWIAFNQAGGTPIKTFISRCQFGAFVSMSSRKYALGARDDISDEKSYGRDILNSLDFLEVKPPPVRISMTSFMRGLKIPFSVAYHNIGVCLKLLAIAFVAEPEFQRELDYALHSSPRIIRSVILFMATGIWKYTKTLQNHVMPIFLLYGRRNVSTLQERIVGTQITLKRQRIAIENTGGVSTAFIHSPCGESGAFEVRQYAGSLDKQPADNAKLQRISTYSKAMLLLSREDYNNGAKGNVYKYEYLTENGGLRRKRLSKIHNPRYPLLRKCIAGSNEFEELNYNYRGLVQSGSYILHGSLIRFNCHYRHASNFVDELLRAEFVLPHLTCTVSWSAPPQRHPERLDRWIPHSQVTEATFVLGSDVYESRWSYDHKFHPTIHTTLNGEVIDTPPIIQWDHLGVLKKPINFSFHHDDLLIRFKTLNSHFLTRWLGLNSRRTPVSTSKARSRLWQAWKDTPGFDGVIVRWLDENLLRKEPLLRDYWRRRDRGDLASAEEFLNNNADAIMATVDLDNSISGWAPLAIKIADLYSFGQGGDANSRTRSKDPDFDNNGLQVLAVDSGTWPNEGGGVSACRRDMINNLRSVHWHMIAESANDFGIPKHQTEMNVRSLKIIPLWGLDFLTPTHGLFKDRLDTEVEHVPRHATKLDVKRNFLPILTALVKGARTSHFSKSDILQTTRALVNLNTYFSESKHWGAIWTSNTVKDAWCNLWISQDLVSPTPSESWFQTEIPTIAQLDGALELWYRYLFIFSIAVPEKIPAIFQASHHSVSASYGIVCKVKRGCTLQIWDHAISWRETNLYLSSDLCSMAPFVRNALLGLMRVTSQLILHHADTILPCADFFNPGWEVEIGTCQGELEHRNIFKRKIDPVVNGIPDMTKFAPIKEIKSKVPTVAMLSHVWYAKDIKTAILAADIIVNEWGFTDYRLDIYGAIDKAPSYSTDCFEIIASKSLPRFVTLCGEANPTTVLEKTWVFLNSSISEGLPLALGEAALTGAPVVCTDVGASLRVLTDPDTGACYSAVVAPNDARNLARAQINFLALLDEWAPYANDPEDFVAPTLTDRPTAGDIETITKRMYEKTEERRALGMRSREIVQKSFGGERYLREHEQMLWIGKARYDLLNMPCQSSQADTAPPMQSLPVPSNVWGTASIPSGVGRSVRRLPVSSVQTASMMASSLQASTLMTPGIRSLFDSGLSGVSGSKTSTSFANSVQQHTPVKKAMPVRVTVLARRGGYESSARSSMRSRQLPGEDSFIHDVTEALERV